MEFIPAGEIIGDAHQIRSVRIAQSPQLPDGEYSFIDMYCSEPGCDCRKTMIQVLHNGNLVSVINYGWESAAFYETWMGRKSDDDFFPPMAGASIDLSSPNRVSEEGILGLFNALLDEMWVARFKHHYKSVRANISGAQ
jgi:hypothetical protein